MSAELKLPSYIYEEIPRQPILIQDQNAEIEQANSELGKKLDQCLNNQTNIVNMLNKLLEKLDEFE